MNPNLKKKNLRGGGGGGVGQGGRGVGGARVSDFFRSGYFQLTGNSEKTSKWLFPVNWK